MWSGLLAATVLLAQNAVPPANALPPSEQQTPEDQPTPPDVNTPPVQTPPDSNTLPAPNVPVGDSATAQGGPAVAPTQRLNPVEQLKQNQAALNQSIQSLGQSTQELGQSVANLDERTERLEEDADTASQYEQELASVVDRGSAIEVARDARLASYNSLVNEINEIDQGLAEGDTGQLSRIEALEQELAGAAQNASAASNPVEPDLAYSTLQSVDVARNDLAGGDFFSAREELAWAQNGILAAIGAAAVNTDVLWRQ